MRPISPKVRARLEVDPMMYICIWNNSNCRNEDGSRPVRVEWEHAFMYAGRQMDEWWAIIGCCWHHHRGGGMVKRFNQWKALERVNDDKLQAIQKKYPRVDWQALRNRLKQKYGRIKT